MMITCGNSELDHLLFSSPKVVLVYGPEGSGKTNFALTILRLSRYRRAVYISTEGSSYVERAEQLSLLDRNDILFANALDLPHLVALTASIPSMGDVDVVIVDSINYHYRAEVSDVRILRLFATLLSVLRNFVRAQIYVIATAQVRELEQGIEPAGMQFLTPWADAIARIELRKGVRFLIVEKPTYIEIPFRITREGVEWTLPRF